MKYLVIGLMIFSGWRCAQNKVRENADEDRIAADKAAAVFYEGVRTGDLVSTYPVMSDDFFLYTSKQEYEIAMDNFKSVTGNIIRYELEDWDSNVTAGDNPTGTYHLNYKVYYDSDTTTETFNLKLENGEVKIIGYKINSKKL